MATIYTKAIQEMYVAYFNRPADPAGLAYWEGVVAASAGNTDAVAAAFAGSAEFKAEYEDLNTTGTLRQIYRNLFNDEADAAGLAYWADLVATGKLSLDKAVTAIAAGAQGVHATTFANKVAVATAFTAALDTDAEKAGYNGELANTAAKEFLATITTDASATAAMAPAALAATVADVIKASVVFTLPTALAAYADAVEARDAFLAEADGDDDEDTSIDIAAAQAEIDLAVADEVTGYAAATSTGVKAALLADEIELRAETLVAANKTLATTTANVAKVTGLAGYVANLEAATATDKAADAAAVAAQGTLDGALVTYNASSAVDFTAGQINANGTITGVIELNSSGSLVLASGVTETTHKGIGLLLTAIKADVAADKAAVASEAAMQTAIRLVNRTDLTAGTPVTDALDALKTEMGLAARPTAIQLEAEFLARAAAYKAAQATVDGADDAPALADVNDFNTLLATLDGADSTNPNVTPYNTAVTAAEAAATAVADLDELVDAQAELDAISTQVESLEDAIGDAEDLFTANDFAVPVTLTAFAAGTAEADIFVAGDVNSTILSFASDDQLFLGTEYTLNTGALSTGNNAVLEVFMSQSGANTVLRLETVAFGSASADAEIVITLTGVNMADVTFANGIISA